MGTLRVVSSSAQAFVDRVEAGRLLAEALADLRGQHPLVLGIPRGGLVLAAQLAQALQGELDLALARKLRAPRNPELAIGAMSEDGRAFVDDHLLHYLGVSPQLLAQEQARVREEIAERKRAYRAVCAPLALTGRLVVITDDGLATGATMRAALRAARDAGPARLICAVPVGAEPTLADLAHLADELVCLRAPRAFSAVGQFYLDFTQVEERAVLAILEQQRRPPAGGNRGEAG